MNQLLRTVLLSSSVVFMAVAAWAQEPAAAPWRIDVVGNASISAKQIFDYVNETSRTMEDERLELSDVATFGVKETATIGTIAIDTDQHGDDAERAAAWLAKLAARGIGYADASQDWDAVLDPSDLGSVLLWEDAVRDDELVLLFAGRQGQNELLEIIDDRRDAVNDERRDIRDAANEEVAAWTDDDWAKSYWRQNEKAQAARSLYRERFNRTHRRQRRALGVQEDILKELVALQEKLTEADDDSLRRKLHRQLDERMRSYIEVHDAAELNDKLGLTRQGLRVLGRSVNRVKDELFGPGSGGSMQSPTLVPSNAKDLGVWQPRMSTFWRRRTAEQIRPDRLFFGPWFDDSKRPTVPVAGQTLKLDGFRDDESDGLHPSVRSTDGRDVEGQVVQPPVHCRGDHFVTTVVGAWLQHGTDISRAETAGRSAGTRGGVSVQEQHSSLWIQSIRARRGTC